MCGDSVAFTCACSAAASAVAPSRSDDEGPRLLQAVLLVADDRALGHVGVRGEALLDLLRGDPDAADLEQVVGAAAVVEEAVGVAREEVAAHDHVARVGLHRLLARVPVHERGVSPSIHSRPVSRRAARAVLVDHPALVARHELAERSGARRARPVGDVDVVGLGGADAVEHLDAEASRASGGAALAAAPRPPRCTAAGRTGLRAGCSSIARIIVGTLTRIVGRCSAMSSKIRSGVERSGKTIPAAPTPNG